MAQTIQIRRGTGSAVPSSLAAGELAINTETGKFYYGNGSAVSSDFRVDSITAESYAISSSVTSYTFQAFSGSTDFGDDIGDIHNRTGSVNVSGSMSIATDLSVAGNLTVAPDSATGNHIKLGNSTLDTNGDFLISGSSLGNPLITLKQSTQTQTYGAPGLKFTRTDASADGSAIGLITYTSPDSADNSTTYVRVTGKIEENQSGQEGGKYTVEIASHDGELQPGLTIEDGDAEDEVDVTIGNTATSETTIAGTLTIGSTAFVNNSGVIQVATQGTIDHDSLANFIANEHIDHSSVSITAGAGLTGGGTIAATRDIAVGAGTGVTVNANDVAIGQDVATTADVLFNSMTAESDGQARMLISTTHASTNRDVGLTLSASSNGQEYTLGLNRASNTFVIAPTNVGNAPNNAVFELDIAGNITASGNVSASGIIYSQYLYADERIYPSNKDGTIFLDADTNSMTVNGGSLNVGSHITASGNISASGEIKANTLDVASTSNFADDITIGDTKKIIGTRLIISASNNTSFYGDTSITGGDLSLNAAGSVLDVQGQGDATDASGDTGAIRTEGGVSIAKKAFIGTQLSVGSHITASGNISASGNFDLTGNANIDGNLDVDGTTNLDAVDIDGNVLLQGTLTVGVSGTGHDVVLYGDTHGKFIKWDQSADLLEISAETNFGEDGTGEDVTFFGDTSGKFMKWDQSMDHLKMYDNTNIVFGTGQFNEADFDASIFWDTADLVIDSETDIKLVADGGNVDVTGNLSVSAAATASTGSFDVMTKALNIIPFAYYVSSVHTSELYIPVAGSLSESNFDQYYHMFHAPYNGTVKRIALSWQSGTPGDSTIRVRKASNFDPDDSGDIVETVVISSAAQDTMYYADFSASFSKGDVVAFTVQQSGTDNSYVGGTIAMEFDTSS